MRLTTQDRADWEEGKRLLAAATGMDASLSDFLRIAAREKLAALRRAKQQKGAK